MKNKVKIIAAFTIVCIILSLIISISIIKFPGGINVEIMSVERSTKSRLKASYRYFNGTNTRKIYLKQGEILKIHFVSEVKKGDLYIDIIDSDGKIIKTLDRNIEGNVDIRAEADGDYTIKVRGDGTRGNYEINWSK